MTTRRTRLAHTLAPVGVLLLLGSCSKNLPGAPSELTTGITIYENANFGGASALLTKDVSDLRDFNGPCEVTTTLTLPNGSVQTSTTRTWNDCISSIRVAPGWRATVYRDDDFKGQSLEVAADVPNLQLVPGSCDHDGLNDCITSIRVRPL